jgi:hypothetical protein
MSTEDEAEWLLLDAEQTADTVPQPALGSSSSDVVVSHIGRMKRTVKKIILLLRLRWLWSTVMSSLNAAAARRRSPLVNSKLRLLAVYLSDWLKAKHNARPLFGHLKRHKGKLMYLDRFFDERYNRSRRAYRSFNSRPPSSSTNQ